MSKHEKDDHHSDEEKDHYKVPTKVGLKDMVGLDKEDKSLENYKKQLLGAAMSEVYAPKDDPRRVVILEMRVILEEKPNNDIVFSNLDNPAVLAKLKDTPFTLKEGCKYKIKLTFRVQHDIVTGLKYGNYIYKLGIRVAKEETMIGSYPPQKSPHEVTFPRIGWEECPSGTIQRGDYKAKSKFIDDDGENHLEYDYSFKIKKDWA
jgi:Rho GDP-dissociation inhibitor